MNVIVPLLPSAKGKERKRTFFEARICYRDDICLSESVVVGDDALMTERRTIYAFRADEKCNFVDSLRSCRLVT